MKWKPDRSNSRLNIKDLIKYASEAKRNDGGFFLTYLTDMVVCSYKYKMSYKEYSIYQFYKLKVEERSAFLMLSDVQFINRIYNLDNASIKTVQKFNDKLQFIDTFKKFTKRPYLNLQTAGQRRFDDFVKEYPIFVSKSVLKKDGDFVEKHQVNEDTDLVALRSELIEKKEFLVEPYLEQEASLANLYPESLNTLRVITYRDADNEVHILNVALKLGSGGIRDDYSRGGLFSVPNEEGLITRPFVNKKGSIYEEHPISKTDLVGYQIPRFEDALDFALEVADLIPEIRYVGWDIAIGDSGFYLLDGSINSKFFQIPPVVTHSTGEPVHNLRAIYEYVMPEFKAYKNKKKRK